MNFFLLVASMPTLVFISYVCVHTPCNTYMCVCVCRIELEAEIRVTVDELMKEELKNLKMVHTLLLKLIA